MRTSPGCHCLTVKVSTVKLECLTSLYSCALTSHVQESPPKLGRTPAGSPAPNSVHFRPKWTKSGERRETAPDGGNYELRFGRSRLLLSGKLLMRPPRPREALINLLCSSKSSVDILLSVSRNPLSSLSTKSLAYHTVRLQMTLLISSGR